MPWATTYGSASRYDVASAAASIRLFDIEVDPDAATYTDAQIATLRAGGANRVLAYLNIGSCEMTRSYWMTVPAGFVSCGANTNAQRGL